MLQIRCAVTGVKYWCRWMRTAMIGAYTAGNMQGLFVCQLKRQLVPFIV